MTPTAGSSATNAAAFFDLDNTLISGSSLYHLARGLRHHDFFTAAEVRTFIWKTLKFVASGKEHIDDMNQIRDMGLNIVAGHKFADMKRVAEPVIDEYVIPKIIKPSLEMARKHLARGEQVWIVTAAPQLLAGVLAQRLGFTGAIGTDIEVVDGEFTGQQNGKTLHGAEKAKAIAGIAAREQLDLSRCTAYSDSINDVPMLSSVGTAVVVNADYQLRRLARSRGWKHCDYRKLRFARRYGIQTLIVGAAGVLAAVFGRRSREK